jgi:thiamine biosynthesis lipoprotein
VSASKTGIPHAAAQADPLSWRALGTNVVLRLAAPERAEPARAAAVRELEAIDLACSRFRPDSELVALNEHAGRWTRVGPLLLEAVELALRAASLTDGVVTPTVGSALELIGYDRDFEQLEPPRETDPAPADAAATLTARMVPAWQAVRVRRVARTVRIPEGAALDLGATAKAWAADRAALAASAAAGCGALVAVGGDVACAGEGPHDGWPVRVADDHRDRAGGELITIRAGGVATSSVVARRWRSERMTMHHIVDPRTGTPSAGPWRTASVAAADCADANIASTAAIVLGDAAPGWLRASGLPARLVAHDGTVTRVSGWPGDD